MRPAIELLRECLEQPERLGSTAGDAFADIVDRLESGALRQLSAKQLEWLLDKCAQLGIDPGAENLVSTGQVRPSPAERKSLALFHDSLGPKVLKPPGRRT